MATSTGVAVGFKPGDIVITNGANLGVTATPEHPLVVISYDEFMSMDHGYQGAIDTNRVFGKFVTFDKYAQTWTRGIILTGDKLIHLGTDNYRTLECANGCGRFVLIPGEEFHTTCGNCT